MAYQPAFTNDDSNVLLLHDPDPRTAFRALLALLQVPVHPMGDQKVEGYDLITSGKPGVWDLIWYGTKYRPGNRADQDAQEALSDLWDKFQAQVNPIFNRHPGLFDVAYVCIRLHETGVRNIIDWWYAKNVAEPVVVAVQHTAEELAVAQASADMREAYLLGRKHAGAEITSKLLALLNDDTKATATIKSVARLANLREAVLSIALEYEPTDENIH